MVSRLSAQAYEELIAQTVGMLTVLDDSGATQYESPSTKRILGYEPDELEGEIVFEYIHPADRQKALDTFDEIVEVDEV